MVCPTYVLESKLQNPGFNIPKWDTRSHIVVNKGFSQIHSTQVELVLNLLTCLISLQYHVVFNDMLYNVASSTAIDPEVWMSLVTSRNSKIQAMLDQEDNKYLDDGLLTSDERLTRFTNIERKV